MNNPRVTTTLDFRAARAALGLSAEGLARVLRLGVHGARTVRRWEAEDFAPSGPVLVLLDVLITVPEARAYLLGDQ